MLAHDRSLFLTDACASLYRLWGRHARDGRPVWSGSFRDALRPWRGRMCVVEFDDPASDDGRFAMVGPRLVEQFERDLTGQRLSEANQVPRADEIRERYAAARRSRRPILSANAFVSEHGAHHYERILLPFGGEGRGEGGAPIDRVVAYLEFASATPQHGWLSNVRDTVTHQEAILPAEESWTRDLPSHVQLRTVATRRGRTSIKLEPSYWAAFDAIARMRGMTLNDLVDEIDRHRGRTPLTRAVRVYILYWYRERAQF